MLLFSPTNRVKQAEILGYPNYAAMSLSTKMAGNADKVWELIHSLKDKSKQAATRWVYSNVYLYANEI